MYAIALLGLIFVAWVSPQDTSECRDLYPQCRAWIRNFFCTLTRYGPETKRKLCARSCHFCTGGGTATRPTTIQPVNESGFLVTRARAYMFAASGASQGGQFQSVGTIDFVAVNNGQHVQVNGTITGLTPGNHGFHIHEHGDYGNNCLLAGSHFNPHGANHGSRDSIYRHVGDLGNIQAGADGTVRLSFDDSVMALNGRDSIVGRGVVVHANIDDLGVGMSPDSRTTGNAGARVACGIVGILEERRI